MNSTETMPKCGREFIAILSVIAGTHETTHEVKAFYEDPYFCDCETGSNLETLYNGNLYWSDVIGWREM